MKILFLAILCISSIVRAGETVGSRTNMVEINFEKNLTLFLSSYKNVHGPFILPETPKLKKVVVDGEIYPWTKYKNDSPWPESQLLAYVPIDPIKALAIFTDWESHSHFIPNLLKSIPMGENSPGEMDIFFELDLPWPLSSTTFISRHTIVKSKSKAYEVKWRQILSDSTVSSEGLAKFFPFGKGCLFYYANFVVPKSFIASLLKQKAITEVHDTFNAILKQITVVDKRAKVDEKIELYLKGQVDRVKRSFNSYSYNKEK